MWGDSVGCMNTRGAKSFGYLSLCCQLFQGHWNCKSDVEVRWGHGNVLCNLSPFYQSFWWGFHFRFPVRKGTRCKIIGFRVQFMCNSRWGQAHPLGDSRWLFVPPTCLPGKSFWLKSGGNLFFFHLPGCSLKKMVNPDGASHCREVVFAWETTHFRVSVWPSSTVMVSVWLVRKAATVEENCGQWGWHKPCHSQV